MPVTVNHSFGVVLDMVKTQNVVLAAVLVTALTEKSGFVRSIVISQVVGGGRTQKDKILTLLDQPSTFVCTPTHSSKTPSLIDWISTCIASDLKTTVMSGVI